MNNPYEILSLSEDATEKEIKERYKFLVLVYHPDRFSNEKLKKKAEEDLKNINQAYQLIMEKSHSKSLNQTF